MKGSVYVRLSFAWKVGFGRKEAQKAPTGYGTPFVLFVPLCGF